MDGPASVATSLIGLQIAPQCAPFPSTNMMHSGINCHLGATVVISSAMTLPNPTLPLPYPNMVLPQSVCFTYSTQGKGLRVAKRGFCLTKCFWCLDVCQIADFWCAAQLRPSIPVLVAFRLLVAALEPGAQEGRVGYLTLQCLHCAERLLQLGVHII